MAIRTLQSTASALALTLAAVLASSAIAQDDLFDNPAERERVVSLKGTWRFSVGDDLTWAAPDFDDRGWTKVDVPGAWEDEGYRGYNGYAWYRREFELPRDHDGRRLYVSVGRIDDVDQVFINGTMIGGYGQFPPHYVTAYDANRVYAIPPQCLRAGATNVIAVRVYDGGARGGIYDGRLGIFSTTYPPLAVELNGPWKLQTGDNPDWARPDCDESGFVPVTVPGFWENAGFPDYDGYAWYRTRFAMTEKPDDHTMVLLLGRIDDLDEVYLNGTRIGGTGDLEHPDDNHGVAFYRQNRGYVFPASLLQGENVVAVRVYDGQGAGGIYAGPLGIMTQTDYIKFWERRRRDNTSLWHWLRHLD